MSIDRIVTQISRISHTSKNIWGKEKYTGQFFGGHPVCNWESFQLFAEVGGVYGCNQSD